jgi:hypothetical protein
MAFVTAVFRKISKIVLQMSGRCGTNTKQFGGLDRLKTAQNGRFQASIFLFGSQTSEQSPTQNYLFNKNKICSTRWRPTLRAGRIRVNNTKRWSSAGARHIPRQSRCKAHTELVTAAPLCRHTELVTAAPLCRHTELVTAAPLRSAAVTSSV